MTLINPILSEWKYVGLELKKSDYSLSSLSLSLRDKEREREKREIELDIMELKKTAILKGKYFR